MKGPNHQESTALLINFLLIITGIIPYSMGGILGLCIWCLPVLYINKWLSFSLGEKIFVLLLNIVLSLLVSSLIDGSFIDITPVHI
ncbi:hypothetical protein [Oceanicoccus sagamiensis]|uniref:hypothetical protein n=1 Tax=Oceanicoccus sagamiensis TaxID=716816 RepID=UPI0012F47BA6|nr:hypothetical protein [Oceanicoccus sagamiensis]